MPEPWTGKPLLDHAATFAGAIGSNINSVGTGCSLEVGPTILYPAVHHPISLLVLHPPGRAQENSCYLVQLF
jgi:hypothetical protein